MAHSWQKPNRRSLAARNGRPKRPFLHRDFPLPQVGPSIGVAAAIGRAECSGVHAQKSYCFSKRPNVGGVVARFKSGKRAAGQRSHLTSGGE